MREGQGQRRVKLAAVSSNEMQNAPFGCQGRGREWRERSLVVIFTKQQFSLAAAAAAAVAAILCEVQLTLISA